MDESYLLIGVPRPENIYTQRLATFLLKLLYDFFFKNAQLSLRYSSERVLI